MTTGKTIALTRRTFVGKVMSLLLNMLSRLVITFLTSWQINGGKSGNNDRLFSWGPESLQMVTAAIKLKDTCSWKKSYDKHRQRCHFANKGPYSQSYGFSSSHVQMWEMDHKEVLKNWSFWTVVLEKILKSPLDCKEIQPVPSKGDQSWVFSGRNDAKPETPVLWPPHAKSWLTGKDWCWEGLGAEGEGDDRGWDGWMASPTQWTWVWVNSWSGWRTGRPGVLWFMGSQRVRHDWATELNWYKHCQRTGRTTSQLILWGQFYWPEKPNKDIIKNKAK